MPRLVNAELSIVSQHYKGYAAQKVHEWPSILASKLTSLGSVVLLVAIFIATNNDHKT